MFLINCMLAAFKRKGSKHTYCLPLYCNLSYNNVKRALPFKYPLKREKDFLIFVRA